MAVPEKVSTLVSTLVAKFEEKANKKTDISGSFTGDTDSYPTAQAVKTYVSGLISGFITKDANDLTYYTKTSDLADVATSGSYADLSNKPTIPTVVDTVADNNANAVSSNAVYDALAGKVDTESGKGLSTNDYTTAEKNKLAAIESEANKTVVDSALSDSSENPVQNKVIKDALDDKLEASDLATVATSGSYADLSNKPTLSSLGGVVTVESVTPGSGYIAAYAVKQNGSQVGSTINIPKDYLVKSASMQTVTTADSPVTGYAVGDKYLDFVINTVDDTSGTGEHIYINVKDLIDTYTADESSITLSNNQFAIKAGGVTKTMLSSAVQTSLGYADDYNQSEAKKITSTDIENWNGKGNSDLTTSDVDDEIESYLDDIISTLNGSGA